MEEDKVIENKIVVELQKKILLKDILLGVALLVIPLVCWIIYYKWEGIVGTISMVVGCIILVLLLYCIVVDLYGILNRVVIEIDDQGVCFPRKKRKATWGEIQSLTCENKAAFYDKTELGKKFYCTLKDGKRIKVDFSDSNYYAEKLHQQITSQFPAINCNFKDPSIASQSTNDMAQVIDGKIVVKNSKSDVITDLVIEIGILAIAILICLYLNVETKIEGQIVLVGYIAIIGLPFAIIYTGYKLFHIPIAVIDDNGIYWARKKKTFLWDQVQSLTCKVKEDKNGNKDEYEHNFICLLKNGESYEADIKKSNFTADELYEVIKSQFPSIECSLLETLEDQEKTDQVNKSSGKDENVDEEGAVKCTDNKIVVEYSKKRLRWNIIKMSLALVVGIFLLWLYAFDSHQSKYLLGGGFLTITFVSLLISEICKMRQRVIAVIDANGVFLPKKKKIFLWNDIEKIDCVYKKEIRDRFGNDQSEQILYCFLSNGDKVEVKITKSKHTAFVLYKEINRQFPSVNCEYRNNL